jgi:hypothetical protein
VLIIAEARAAGADVDQGVSQPLMIPLAMVMGHELGERMSKVAVAERHDAIQTFLFD